MRQSKAVLSATQQVSGVNGSLGKWLAMCAMVLSSLSFGVSAADSSEFDKRQLTQVKQQYDGERWLMLLWSVECPPCFKELAQIGKLAEENPDLPVVLINSDGDEWLDEQREALIEKYGLSKLQNLHFADGKAAKGRFVIDPSWYGELPRSYFYKSDGSRVAKSGLVATELLAKWLTPRQELVAAVQTADDE